MHTLLAQKAFLSCCGDSKIVSTVCTHYVAQPFPQAWMGVWPFCQWIKKGGMTISTHLEAPVLSQSFFPHLLSLCLSLWCLHSPPSPLTARLFFSIYPFTLFFLPFSHHPPFHFAQFYFVFVVCVWKREPETERAWGMAELGYCDGGEGWKFPGHYWQGLSGATLSHCLSTLVSDWPPSRPL